MHVFAGICWNVLLFATGAEEGGDACCGQGEKKTLCSAWAELLEISLFLLFPLRT